MGSTGTRDDRRARSGGGGRRSRDATQSRRDARRVGVRCSACARALRGRYRGKRALKALVVVGVGHARETWYRKICARARTCLRRAATLATSCMSSRTPGRRGDCAKADTECSTSALALSATSSSAAGCSPLLRVLRLRSPPDLPASAELCAVKAGGREIV